MLFEQKSWRKSSVEIMACPYKSLTTLYFLLRFPQRFLAVGNFNNEKLRAGGYSAKLFSISRIEIFFSSVVLAHRMMCAAKGCMQMGRLAYTDADNTMQLRA